MSKTKPRTLLLTFVSPPIPPDDEDAEYLVATVEGFEVAYLDSGMFYPNHSCDGPIEALAYAKLPQKLEGIA